jgi:hypothetical protein
MLKIDSNNLLKVSNTVAARSKAWTLFASRTPGLTIRIPVKALMSVCVYSVFVLSCVGRGLVIGWSIVKESYRPCKEDYETAEESRAQQRAVVPLMNV